MESATKKYKNVDSVMEFAEIQQRKPKPRSHRTCCVYKCGNTELKNPDLHFYRIPSVSNSHGGDTRRETWLRLLRLKRPDSSSWRPSVHTRICSAHFTGNEKSDDSRSPSYNPTIFPEAYRTKPETSSQKALERYQRILKRESLTKDYTLSKDSSFTENEQPARKKKRATKKQHKEVQCNSGETDGPSDNLFFCGRIVGLNSSDVEIQTLLSPKKFESVALSNGAGDFDATEFEEFEEVVVKCEPSTKDEETQKPIENEERSSNEASEETEGESGGFRGVSSIENDQQMLDMAGVTFEAFNLLLNILIKNKTDAMENTKKKMSDENKLLMFLMRMKDGLSFVALGVFFNMHRTSLSRNFYSTLDCLSKACKSYVFWLGKEIASQTMPPIFKPNYKKCKLIIHFMDIKVDKPATKEEREKYYSLSEKAYLAKNIIGFLPCGYICFASKCHRGEASEDKIVNSSKIIDSLEEGDLVLTNKDIPEVRKLFEEKGILTETPSMSYYEEFPELENEYLHTEAEVKVHMIKMEESVRNFKILQKFNIEMLQYCDKIVLMCCVLANLQSPVIKVRKIE